jgi:ADP-heptose:LPS heptosyltransferase
MKILERLLKKTVLSIASVLWNRKPGSMPIPALQDIKSILIYRPEKIGDLFVSFPLIAALIKNNPKIQIDLLISQLAYPLIEGDERFRNIFVYKKSFWEDIKTARWAGRYQYDIIIDLVGSDSATAALTVLYLSKGQSLRIAVGKRNLARYYNFNFDIMPDRHMIESTLQILRLWKIDDHAKFILSPPFIQDKHRALADSFMDGLNLSSDEKAIGINISVGDVRRLWRRRHYLSLMELIKKKYPFFRIIIFATPDDYIRGELLSKMIPEVSVIPRGLSLLEASAILSKMSFFVSPDTSMVHIARSFGIPVVGLYIPSQDNYRRWFPIGQKRGVIITPDDYSIDRIAPEAVIKEMERVLAETK